MTSKRLRSAAVAALAGSLALAAVAIPASAESNPDFRLSGAGATFSQNFIEDAANGFFNETGISVSYAGVGSGAGRTLFRQGAVDFAGSDVGFSDDEAQRTRDERGNFVYLPIAAGGIALAYNLPETGQVQLSPSLIARIFTREITRWDDQAIREANPDVLLPELDITTIVRAESSGTTTVFTQYMTATSESWYYGSRAVFPAENGQVPVAGSAGVAEGVSGIVGAIGYVEVSSANERGLQAALVLNNAGSYVYPSPDAISEAIAGAQINQDATRARLQHVQLRGLPDRHGQLPHRSDQHRRRERPEPQGVPVLPERHGSGPRREHRVRAAALHQRVPNRADQPLRRAPAEEPPAEGPPVEEPGEPQAA